jgi:elongin-A
LHSLIALSVIENPDEHLFKMPASSLIDCCTKACIKNVRSMYSPSSSNSLLTPLGLTDIGHMEYFQVRSILQRIDSPEQLHQIEIHSPQIKGEDAELWRAFIARDIPTWAEKNYVPKNPRKWYDIYCRYKEEQQKDIEAAEATLKESMLGIQKHRATHVSKVVDMKTLPKLPRDPRMLANNGGVPLNKHKGFKKEGASSLAWTAGSKTKLTDGRSVLTRARREAKEISQMSKLAKPTHQLSGRMGQVVRAPPAMVNEYRTANQPALKILSRKTNIVRRSDIRGGIDRPSLEAREARLRALTSGGAGTKRDAAGLPKATMVGSSDEDEDDEYYDEGQPGEDPFDDELKPRTTSSIPSRPSKPPPKSQLSSARPQVSRPRPPHSSSPPLSTSRPAPKPSDVISSIISKPKPRQLGSSPSPPKDARSRSGSPGMPQPPKFMPKKRTEVDIFNRGAKKPKVR